MGQYFKECDARKRMETWDREMEEWQKMRDQVGFNANPYIEMGYDSFALAYFNYFGHGFAYRDPRDGRIKYSPIMDNEYKGWKCPRCGIQHMGTVSTLPSHCRCGGLTPMGEFIAAGAYRRL